jgi:hypothetical protein
MNNRTKSNRLEVPAVLAGSWKGEIAGKPHAHFGQQTQPGKPPRSVEFSYTMLPVTLTMPDNSFTWPGALFIMAPHRIEKRLERAGTLFSGSQLPALVLSLNVTRAQYSDLLWMIVTKKFGPLDFTVEERVGNSWPIRSWGMATSLP